LYFNTKKKYIKNINNSYNKQSISFILIIINKKSQLYTLKIFIKHY